MTNISNKATIIQTGVGIDTIGINPKRKISPAKINKIFDLVINPNTPATIATITVAAITIL